MNRTEYERTKRALDKGEYVTVTGEHYEFGRRLEACRVLARLLAADQPQHWQDKVEEFLVTACGLGGGR